MKTKSKPKNTIEPIYLHLELDTSYSCSERELQILKEYANIKHGTTISRDVFVPGDMTLGALHYTIQKLFGWMNRYEHFMKLPDHIFNYLTEDKTEKWADLVGVLFRFSLETDEEYSGTFDDPQIVDFENRFSNYYTGPYDGFSTEEECDTLYMDVSNLLDDIAEMNKRNNSLEIDKLSKLFTGDQEQDEKMRNNSNDLLGKYKVSSVLAYESADIDENLDYVKYDLLKEHDENSDIPPKILPFTYKLVYVYDSKRRWKVNITMPDDYSNLMFDKGIAYEEIVVVKDKVKDSYKPYCIFRDGVNVLEDVENMVGFCKFLTAIFESENLDEVNEALKFGRRRDWHYDEIDDPIMF